MRKVAKLMGISLLALGLAACDGDTKDTKAAPDGAAASAPAGQQVSLLDGKLAFTLPVGMADQTSKLEKPANNMHAYADSTSQRLVVVILGDKTADSLETLAQRLENNQRANDANLQLITNKAIEVDGVPLRQLDSIVTNSGKKAYSSILVGALNNNLLTIQISLPADNQQQAQTEAEGIISTLKLKQ
ncbi:DcrB family lipoprotein [Serratia ureilytica]|uniref:DcrB family lipoprotein n=1 Tax=Serratia ureilytica TaxID=300181 RepID=UPI00191D6FDF|nr:DcrB family lipoprotein [Serratia ureilytica]QQU63144.1 DcrB family lipoprotein [Serratia ureilytica]